MLVAAFAEHGVGRASSAHVACAGRYLSQNNISGMLPTEIGKLSSLMDLCDLLSLCEGFDVLLMLPRCSVYSLF